MRLIIFGIGKYYLNRKEKLFQLCKDAEIVCYMDNNIGEGAIFEGKQVFRPNQLKNVEYDRILLMSRSFLEMKKQLITLGYSEEVIWTWNQFTCDMSHGKYEFFCGKYDKQENLKSILIISTDLNYNGGSIAIGYAAKELSNRYDVVLAAPGGDLNFISEIVSDGINVLLCPALLYMGKEEKYLISKFDIIIVNVFQMLPVVRQVSGLKPTLWWIHEPSDLYEDIMYEFEEYVDNGLFKDINIRAVSRIPRENFNVYFPDRISDTMAYGIPDTYQADAQAEEKEQFVFAIIGGVVPRKAQDIFLEAVNKVEGTLANIDKVEYWIIGYIGNDLYSNKIRDMAKMNSKVKIKGLLSREEMGKVYRYIDAVVCPSREDPLPIVMTEGMMYGKVCIASDATGTADYIRDGENGLVCQAGSAESLAGKMCWVMEHPDQWKIIGENARKTYEKYFTMDKFGERLEKAVQETMEKYGRK